MHAKHKATIEAHLPETITSIETIKEGWTYLVYDVNDRWIFRFVRNRENTQFALERDFLPRFAAISPVPVPNIRWSGGDFTAYRKIVGERFSAENLALLSKSEKAEFAKIIGRFLTTLHNFQFEHPSLSTAPYGGGDFWGDIWPEVEPALPPTLRTRAKTYLTATFELLGATPQTLIHGDLGPNHVRLDVQNRKLGGIIDFGDLQLGDPAYDFSSLYRDHGRNFVDEILVHYDRPLGDHFWQRVEYSVVHKLLFALYFARQHPEHHGVIPLLNELIIELFENTNGKWSW